MNVEEGPELTVVEDVAAAAAERIAETVRAGGHIVLSGGSTPEAAHERVAEMDLDWSAATLWFGDDRAVVPDNEFSNYGMARRSLLDRIGNNPPAVHRIRGELGHEAAAHEYERELRGEFGDEGPPSFDLLLLGLGPDAHVASLFPGDPALLESERWVVGVPTPGMEPMVSRVTFTLPVINAAREVLFLVSGEGKAEAVERGFRGVRDSYAPASLVRPDPGRLTILVDEPAAARALGGDDEEDGE